MSLRDIRPERLDHLSKLMRLIAIQKKDMDVGRLDLEEPFAWAQKGMVEEVAKQYNAEQPVRVICLKARQLGMCLDPSTRVLTSDLRWVAIADLYPGDELVAVDEFGVGTTRGGRASARKMRKAVVESCFSLQSSGLRLTFEDGTELVLTDEHRLLSRRRGNSDTEWRRAESMKVGDFVRYVTQPWGDSDVEDGWFGGLLDGEGSLAQNRAGSSVNVSQVFGPVYDRAERYLKERGFTVRYEQDIRVSGENSKLGSKPLGKLVVSRTDEMFRLLGLTRPERFIGRTSWWEGHDLPGKRSGIGWKSIVRIEPVAKQPMVDLRTSTGTYIAEGLVSHNSTASAAVLFNWAFLLPGAQGMIIAHDTETTQSLFEKTQLAWEHWPMNIAYTLRHQTQRRLTWKETNSSIRIATAKNVKSGRGRTIHALHASEVAFWDDPETLMTGLRQTIPNRHGTIIIMESTANGVGNYFWRQWQMAETGDSEFSPLFFPWYFHPEYRATYSTIRVSDLDEYETWLYDELKVPIECLEWRRWAIPNLCNGDKDAFIQEYPSTADEAFLTTGRPVFPVDGLRKCYHEAPYARGYVTNKAGRFEFVNNPLGELRVFKKPFADRAWRGYFVAADPSRSTIGDPSCIQVINRQTFEQVAVWHGVIDPVSLAEKIIHLGHYYNDAEVSCEIEGGGQATIGAILAAGYPHVWQHRRADKHQGHLANTYGWSTNFQRKNWMIGNVAKLLNDGSIVLHDQITYDQMLDYVVLNAETGSTGNASRDGHDDAVMAFCQAVICTITEGPLGAYETARPWKPQMAADIGGVPPHEAFD